jgi:hypothetical protein
MLGLHRHCRGDDECDRRGPLGFAALALLGVLNNLFNMRRHWLSPIAAPAMALWVALVVGEPGIVDPCPVHGNVASAAGVASETAPPADAHAAAHATAPAVAGGGAHGGVPHSAPAPQHQHKDCNCLGCCTGGVVAAILPTIQVVAFTATISEPEFGRPPVEIRARVAPAHTLPYTTGPPLA